MRSFLALACVALLAPQALAEPAKDAKSAWPQLPEKVRWEIEGTTPYEFKTKLIGAEKCIDCSSPEAVARSFFGLVRLKEAAHAKRLEFDRVFNQWLADKEEAVLSEDFATQAAEQREKALKVAEQAQKADAKEGSFEIERVKESEDFVIVQVTLATAEQPGKPVRADRYRVECVFYGDRWRMENVSLWQAEAKSLSELQWAKEPTRDQTWFIHEMFQGASAKVERQEFSTGGALEETWTRTIRFYRHAARLQKRYRDAFKAELVNAAEPLLGVTIQTSLLLAANEEGIRLEAADKRYAKDFAEDEPTVKVSWSTATVQFEPRAGNGKQPRRNGLRLKYEKSDEQWLLGQLEMATEQPQPEDKPAYSAIAEPLCLATWD